MEDFLSEASPPPSPSPGDISGIIRANHCSRHHGHNNLMAATGPRSGGGVNEEDSLPQSVLRLIKSISLSVEMFATVGETIGDENADIRIDMLEACRESRSVCNSLEKLCTTSISPLISDNQILFPEPETLVRNTRCLLAVVTRILLLADNVVVKQLLVAKDTNLMSCNPSAAMASATSPASTTSLNLSGLASSSPLMSSDGKNSLKTMHHFNEFVKAFCDFGIDMIHLVHLILGDRDNQPRIERRRAQVDCARLVLERSSSLLLISAKTFICYPLQPSARENRDTVFCQMRRALDLIHFIIKEGVVECLVRFNLEEADPMTISNDDPDLDQAHESTVLKAIKYLEDSVDIMRMSFVSDSYKEQLNHCLESIVERTQDFTDSAHTSNEHRQNILLHCDRAKVELAHLLRSMSLSAENSSAPGLLDISPLPTSEEVDSAIRSLTKATTELKIELRQTAIEGSAFLLQYCRLGSEILLALQETALMGDFERLQMQSSRFSEHIDYVEDVSKLLKHVTQCEALQIRAKHAQINLRIYGPQVIVAGCTLCQDPHSKVAKTNLESFCTMWKLLIDDVVYINQLVQKELQKPINIITTPHSSNLNPPVIMKHPPTPNQNLPPYAGMIQDSIHDPHQSGMLNVSNNMTPNLGKFNKSVPNLSSSNMHVNNQDFLDPFRGSMEPPRRHSTSSVIPGQYPPKSNRPEDVLDSFKDVENNEIVKRSKKMATQANDMFDFTRGFGKVRTTQDLFTLAEFFAEEANALYKVIRLFSYDVPTGEDKRLLMAIADHVPKHCHQLQMLIQTPTVGKAASFTKVDSIIKESREIMLLIVKVVQICYNNASKYNLDFSNVSLEGRGNSVDDPSMSFGTSSGSASGNTSGNDSS